MDPVNLAASANSVGGAQVYAVYDALAFEDPFTGSVVAQIAESITSTDALNWTVKIRPNVKFSDGTSYDAAAVKFHIDRVADVANRSPNAAVAQSIQSLTVADALTLRMTLKAASGQWPRSIARFFPHIPSPTAVKAAGADFANHPVGAGPFVMKDWVRAGQMVLVRNPTYFNAPQPYLDQLTYQVILDDTQRGNTFQASDAQNAVYQDPKLAAAAAKPVSGARVISTFPLIGRDIRMNVTRAPFNDLRVRKALAFAVDQDDFNKVVYDGLATPIPNIFRPESPFYDVVFNLPKFDRAQAQALFDQVFNETGKPITFAISASTATKQEVDYWQAVLGSYNHVSVAQKLVTSTQLVTVCTSHDFDALIFSAQGIDPDTAFSDNFTTNGARNCMGYSNSEVDAAIKQGALALDTPSRVNAYKTVQQNLVKDLPMAWYRRAQYLNVFKSQVRNVSLVSADGILRVDQVWLAR